MSTDYKAMLESTSNHQPTLSNPVDPVVMWMIWDGRDGDEVVIRSCDYLDFCKKSGRDFWGFEVSVMEVGVFRSDQEAVDTYDLNLKVEST